MTAATTATKRGAAAEAWALLFEFFTREKPRWAALASEFELSMSQAHALSLLAPDRPLTMSELAHALVCDASNVTGIVDRLEARGLIVRRPAEHDRRVKLLCVTDAGAELRERALQRLFEPPDEIARLSAADQRALRDVLRRALAR